ncbi:GIY-YIG nuclease family protein [Sulfitobacter delicatus]|uniref:T5orf172 domain-containing protein n=1 Tax=Sulfitobacter delicatus TaxID=218672 RepID=A0A1G7PMG9_9RHOB|nr:GIY-YIG nuclease family protein [Sulfitobacter delicatus]SDF87416.1 T5orf172 domain-containing protein [Sulfitobacter delicatus]
MKRYRSLDDIFEEDDELGLLADIRPRRSNTSSPEGRNAEIVVEVNDFYEAHGRLPDESGATIEEMKLGTIWRSIRSEPSETMVAADRNRLLGYGRPFVSSAVDGTTATKSREPSWRDDPDEVDVPLSLDDIFDEDDDDIPEAMIGMRHVTPAAEREKPAHRADMIPCADFGVFEQGFVDMQAKLDAGEREASPVEDRQELRPKEGDFMIHRGLLAYVAEITEHTRRGGKPDHRLRIIFSNGMESDPLMSSLRKALWADRTARAIHRPGLGPLDPDWNADALQLTGTIYVARSKSERPEIKEVRNILHKIGVTSQDVKRRVADAKNDPTFLLADVEIVATYELRNLSRMKIEDLLHRFFDVARPSGLTITDRFGKKVFPREWFYVLPDHIAEAVRLIEAGTLHLYRYDTSVQQIIRLE